MHSLHLQAIHLTSGWLYFWGTESDLRHKRCTEISKQILRSRCKFTYTKTRQLPQHRRIEPLCLRYGWLDYQNVWVCYEGTLSGISSSVLTLPCRDVIDQTRSRQQCRIKHLMPQAPKKRTLRKAAEPFWWAARIVMWLVTLPGAALLKVTLELQLPSGPTLSHFGFSLAV